MPQASPSLPQGTVQNKPQSGSLTPREPRISTRLLGATPLIFSCSPGSQTWEPCMAPRAPSQAPPRVGDSWRGAPGLSPQGFLPMQVSGRGTSLQALAVPPRQPQATPSHQLFHSSTPHSTGANEGEDGSSDCGTSRKVAKGCPPRPLLRA